MTKIIKGELEIDADRGVIYFHAEDPTIIEQFGSVSILRICGLPRPIPGKAIDITIAPASVFDPTHPRRRNPVQVCVTSIR